MSPIFTDPKGNQEWYPRGNGSEKPVYQKRNFEARREKTIENVAEMMVDEVRKFITKDDLDTCIEKNSEKLGMDPNQLIDEAIGFLKERDTNGSY